MATTKVVQHTIQEFRAHGIVILHTDNVMCFTNIPYFITRVSTFQVKLYVNSQIKCEEDRRWWLFLPRDLSFGVTLLQKTRQGSRFIHPATHPYHELLTIRMHSILHNSDGTRHSRQLSVKAYEIESWSDVLYDVRKFRGGDTWLLMEQVQHGSWSVVVEDSDVIAVHRLGGHWSVDHYWACWSWERRTESICTLQERHCSETVLCKPERTVWHFY